MANNNRWLTGSVSGGKANAEQVDIRDPASVRQFFTKAKETYGRLDSIISAQGPSITLGPLIDSSRDMFQNVVETDVMGTYNVVQHGVPILRTEGRAGTSLLIFVTCAVLKTLDYDGLSSIPKKAVEGIIKQTAREVGRYGIRVNGLAPGVIDAGMVLNDFTQDEYGSAVLKICSDGTPLGRRGLASEVAEVAEFLISDRASYVSGQILGVDGGYSA